MAIQSMTGFARAEGSHGDASWAWEVKSVNGKGLDARCRLPSGFDGLEPKVRAAIAERFRRGNISASLNVTRSAEVSGYKVNVALLDQVADALDIVKGKLPDAAPPRLDGILALRGLIEVEDERQSEDERKTFESAVMKGLEEVLLRLEAGRNEEGARLAEVLSGHVSELERLSEGARNIAATQPDAITARLKTQVEALLASVPALTEERLAQEAALLMTKADIREEIDRLRAHLEAVRELLSGGGAVGRRLDFLCQELNREANTLCSKSSDVDLTRLGLDLKATIDQFREQVQNIE
ncbi:MAG: YicC family protein [Rhodospirillales bacterium]|nr:YicC family protein [Rhodospirillales bacterium]